MPNQRWITNTAANRVRPYAPRSRWARLISSAASVANQAAAQALFAGGQRRRGQGVRRIISGKKMLGSKFKKSKKKMKVTVIDKKPKMTKFHQKVLKIIDHTENLGKITYIMPVQLRQVTLDRYSIVQADSTGTSMDYGNILDINNYFSTMFGPKVFTANYTTITNNFSNKIKFNIDFYYVRYVIKSTSSHVLNIEHYECTAKKDTDVRAYSAVEQSYQSMNANATDIAGAFTSGTGHPVVLGTTSDEWVDLHKAYSVKCRKIRLEPGAETSFTTRIYGNRTMNGAENIVAGAPYLVNKGSKSCFFRIINSATIAGTATSAVHNWPSTPFGGCAIQCFKILKGRPPREALESTLSPTVLIRNFNEIQGGGTDQQVCVNNPIASTTFG